MTCYLLIGGRSRRMGRSKVELPLAGATFFQRVAGAAGVVFDAVIAVQRHGGQAAGGNVATIFEPPCDDAAPALGVRCALRHAAQRCFILAVDYPLVTAEVLRFLRERTEQSAASLVVPRWSDRLQMLCAGYDAPALSPRLDARIAEGRLDLRGLVAEVQTDVIEEDEMRRRFGGQPLMNVNSPDELQEAARYA
jgi:molybdopterin-guanine dinucleotide biosynthesis protein A